MRVASLAFLAAWMSLLLVGQLSPAEPAGFKTLEIGDQAPDFDLPGVDGKKHSLRDFAGAKLLLVVFTCNHCPTAQAYEQRIIRLHADYKDQGVALVAISPNNAQAVRLDELGYTDVGDSLDDMKLRAEERGYTFPYLYDGETQKTALAYGVVATPQVFLFDGQRKLRYAGRIDDSDVKTVTSHDARNALDALLAGKPVPVEKTRTFGCSTKWIEKRADAEASLAKWDQEPVKLESIDETRLEKLVKNDTENLLLVNVWATWCGPCAAELPDLVAMQRMYRQRKFQLVTISLDEPEKKDNALKALEAKHVAAANYISAISNRDRLADLLDKKWEGPVPYTLLIAPGGKVIHRQGGPIEPLELRRPLSSIWAGRMRVAASHSLLPICSQCRSLHFDRRQAARVRGLLVIEIGSVPVDASSLNPGWAACKWTRRQRPVQSLAGRSPGVRVPLGQRIALANQGKAHPFRSATDHDVGQSRSVAGRRRVVGAAVNQVVFARSVSIVARPGPVPMPAVAQRVEQPPGIRLLLADRMDFARRIGARPGVLVGVRLAIAAVVHAGRSRASGVLQPDAIRKHHLPTWRSYFGDGRKHMIDRIAIRNGRRQLRLGVGGSAGRVVLQQGPIGFDRELRLLHVKRSGDRFGMLRFVRFVAGFGVWAPHLKLAGRYQAESQRPRAGERNFERVGRAERFGRCGLSALGLARVKGPCFAQQVDGVSRRTAGNGVLLLELIERRGQFGIAQGSLPEQDPRDLAVEGFAARMIRGVALWPMAIFAALALGFTGNVLDATGVELPTNSSSGTWPVPAPMRPAIA